MTTQEVRIGRMICGGHLPLAVVEQRFQNDLTSFRLKTVQAHDWDLLTEEMKSGKLAGTFALSPLALNMIRQGLPAKIVLIADRNGNGIVLSKAFQSLSDLKRSKTIVAVPHVFSQQHLLLRAALDQHDVNPDDVSIISMPPRDMINSLRRSEIDGIVVGEPEANKSISLGVGRRAAISPQIWKNHPDHVFLVSNRFIHEHPERVQELVSVLVRAGRYIEKYPHAAAVMGESYTGTRPAVFERVLTSPPDWIDFSNMVPSTDDIRALSTRMVKMELWKDMPDDLEMFVDRRFVKKAMESFETSKR